MTGPRIGSLCSGYGGLDRAVQEVFGGDIAWFFEYDKAPSKILAHHWPDVPNYGDMTTADWAAIEQVDILCGGTPCQDLSGAGKRKGMTEGTRSNLWVQMREAIAIQRPSIVIWENVRGAYSASADSEVERESRLLGEDRTGPYLRALGRVLGDLSSLGYDSRVVPLRASDVGAPHQRYRVFVIAYAQDDRRQRGGSARSWRSGSTDSGEHAPNTSSERLGEHAGEPSQEEAGANTGDIADGADRRGAARNGRPSAADATSTRRGRREDPGASRRHAGQDGSGRVEPERDRVPAAGNANDSRLERRPVPSERPSEWAAGSDDLGAGRWGRFGPAIHRWARILNRPAPAPTNPDGKNGAHRLSPVAVEFMMGLPLGHVTDPAIGLSRTEQLKALGNGVVSQQAAQAIRIAVNTREVHA